MPFLTALSSKVLCPNGLHQFRSLLFHFTGLVEKLKKWKSLSLSFRSARKSFAGRPILKTRRSDSIPIRPRIYPGKTTLHSWRL
jgi:hypothetical protein